MPVRFIEPMLLLKTDTLPKGDGWEYELKVDGYRALAFKERGALHLRSRNDKDFATRYPGVLKGLQHLPDNTMIDGEIVALDAEGKPSFNALQNYSSSHAPLLYFVFDVLVLAGADVTRRPLSERRKLLRDKVLPKLAEPVRWLAPLEGSLEDLIHAVKTQGFEGLVAKRADSAYEPGQRSGAWMKMRVNRGQEFVIGGYTIGAAPFDAVILGFYERGQLIYAARTRNGFTPATRRAVFKKFAGLEIAACPFINLPEAKSGRWGAGLTKAKMADCRWLKPVLVAQIEFLEWTDEHHLRHSRFVALREDRNAREVGRE